MAKKTTMGGTGSKKGRNKAFCDRYRLEGRREKNKKNKLLRHIKKHPNDTVTQEYCVENRVISAEQIKAFRSGSNVK